MTDPTLRRAQPDLEDFERAIRQGWTPPQPQRSIPRLDATPKLQPLDDLGRMSAEAVRTQYDETAKAFELMGEEVKSRIARLQTSLEEADASMRLLTEAAAAIREKGKLAHAQVEEMSSVSKIVREMCDEVMKKVGP